MMANWPTIILGILALAVIVLALILLDKDGGYVARSKAIFTAFIHFLKSVLSLQWLVSLAALLREIGGNVSESAFMLATIYVSIDFVAPQLVKWVLPVDAWRQGMMEICGIAFTILPELILIIALLEVWKHVVMWRHGGGKRSLAWAIAYGLPTFCFLMMATYTLGAAVVSRNIDSASLPNFILIARAMAGFTYCIVQAIYQKGDNYSGLMNSLKTEAKTAINALQSAEKKVEELESNLKKALEENARLQAGIQRKAVQENVQDEDRSPEEIIEWLRSYGRSTIDLSEANVVMRQSKRRMDNAVKRGEIRPTKNPQIVFIDSLIAWYCKEIGMPVPENLTAAPALKMVPNSDENSMDKLEITLAILRDNPTISDEELAPHLNLKRPASARFWRLKAEEMLKASSVVEADDPVSDPAIAAVQ
ncbi:MAG: hypothetical protein J2P36_12310 [Ktedonobacteraceae bacterium]|nr:hypothetical protein [Ktedonobacteraceae bacterium]